MYWLLDEKTRITGCHMIRDAVQKVIGEEGIETYRCFIREVIEEGRQAFLRRMKELTVPGTYFVPAFSEVPFKDEPRIPQYAARDTLMHAPFRMEIRPDGELHIGFEGATGWGWHSMNCTPSAIQGAVWVLLSQTIIPNDKVNDGAYLATQTRLPKGTWTNPDVTFVSTSVSWFFLIPAFTGMFLGLSRAFFARGFLEEVVAGYGLTANLFHGGGIDHYGQLSAATNFDMSCVGGGAGAAKDGLDFGAAMWNPEGDMGDVEVWELIEPFLYLGRRVKANTAGPGKFRGGSGFESQRMAWKNGPYEVQNMNAGRMFAASGLFGGYPAASSYRHNLHRTDLVESARRGRPYPVRDGDPEVSEMTELAKGEREFDKRTITLPRLYEPGDLYLSVLNGAPGFGDPLEREPARVAADVQGGVLLPRYAERVYGVMLRPSTTAGWEVDVEATARRRVALREERRRRAVPAAEWVQKERERIMRRGLIEPVQQMYRESMSLNEGWARTYREFWSLPEDFTF
jgi:N-methylhydantoinase B/acetone carboxylase alpha subunit